MTPARTFLLSPLPLCQTLLFFFFLNDPPPPEFYPLPLHDALPTAPGAQSPFPQQARARPGRKIWGSGWEKPGAQREKGGAVGRGGGQTGDSTPATSCRFF